MYAVLAIQDHHNPPALAFLEKQNNNKKNKNKTIFEYFLAFQFSIWNLPYLVNSILSILFHT